jgi:phosphopantothenoylcysteine decarboxylase
MARVLLGLTGSVAAVRAPALVQELRDAGCEVKAVATRAARYFFDAAGLGRDPASPADFDRTCLFLDEDEWPGAGYRRDDPVLHIELRRWAELFVIAPLDANTLAKLAYGLADNCLTCVWRAWDRTRPVVLAPAMNTLMWEHPLTLRHLQQLAADFVDRPMPNLSTADDVLSSINAAAARLRIVGPQSKRLACGDIGMGGLAEVADIVATVKKSLITDNAG